MQQIKKNPAPLAHALLGIKNYMSINNNLIRRGKETLVYVSQIFTDPAQNFILTE